jgi:hypothetical protein
LNKVVVLGVSVVKLGKIVDRLKERWRGGSVEVELLLVAFYKRRNDL